MDKILKGLEEIFEQEKDILLDPNSTDEEKNRAELRLNRMVSDYKDISEVKNAKLKIDNDFSAMLHEDVTQKDKNIMEHEVELDRSKKELTGTIVGAVIGAAAGLIGTGVWIKYEKTDIVTGQTGKEVLRNVVSTIFRRR